MFLVGIIMEYKTILLIVSKLKKKDGLSSKQLVGLFLGDSRIKGLNTVALNIGLS